MKGKEYLMNRSLQEKAAVYNQNGFILVADYRDHESIHCGVMLGMGTGMRKMDRYVNTS